ncbi:MAG: stage 0 sporulation protein [Lentisphaeria bacterium]|nr:stage 0 sporulation protein [Lentisphaeria bacterium]
MEFLYDILLDNGYKYKARGEETLGLKAGDFCIIRKDFFLDYGQVIAASRTPYDPDAAAKEIHHSGPPSEKRAEIPRIQRKATMLDKSKANENTMRAKSALRTTAQFIEKLNLPMKLINAHYAFDGKLLAIQFSAEGRVDFRELVKQLSTALNTRIELRQIGVRDETAIVGGLSICGRKLCCCSFLTEFASINVKMAKEQDLSLTPSTISGMCGRLKCCLKYEHEGYLELEKTMPRRGDCCECKEGRGRIIDRNLLTQNVVVQLDDTGRTVACSREDVNVVYPEKYKVRRNPNRGDEKDPEELSKLED